MVIRWRDPWRPSQLVLQRLSVCDRDDGDGIGRLRVVLLGMVGPAMSGCADDQLSASGAASRRDHGGLPNSVGRPGMRRSGDVCTGGDGGIQYPSGATRSCHGTADGTSQPPPDRPRRAGAQHAIIINLS